MFFQDHNPNPLFAVVPAPHSKGSADCQRFLSVSCKNFVHGVETAESYVVLLVLMDGILNRNYRSHCSPLPPCVFDALSHIIMVDSLYCAALGMGLCRHFAFPLIFDKTKGTKTEGFQPQSFNSNGPITAVAMLKFPSGLTADHGALAALRITG